LKYKAAKEKELELALQDSKQQVEIAKIIIRYTSSSLKQPRCQN
jgi:hypothetical protein